MAQQLSNEQNPDSELINVKYFTADIKAKLSSHGEKSCKAQQDYLLSLQAYSKSQNIKLEIIKGKYNVQPKEYYAYQEPIDFDNKLAVWVAEEKQTDVAIAVHLLCDTIDNNCEQIIIFSNDSDISPAIAAIKERNPNMVVGIIVPVKEDSRHASAELEKYSNWTRNCIKEAELEKNQLPDKINTRKRVISKPKHW